MGDEWENLSAALGKAQPAYCTRPTPGAPHDLTAARIVAKALGTPLFPWQALLIRIASERRIDDPTRYRWPIVIITTPRQVGKTTAYRVYQVTKCLLQPGRQAFYTAQTGKDARARWLDIVKALEAETSPFKKDIKVRKSAGDPTVLFSNGSSISPFAPTAESLHGYTPHDVAIDEAFAFDDAQGTDLMGAILPAQQRRADRQLLIFSTAGNLESTWLRAQVEKGRQLAADPGAGIAYLEWSMPEGADPEDPETWLFHPGITDGFTLDDMRDQFDALKDKPGEWLRAYMNTWTDEADQPPILTPDEVTAVTTEQTPPEAFSDVALAYEIALDRSRAVIAAAWYDPNTGRPAVRIMQRFNRGDEITLALLKQIEKEPLIYGADDGGTVRDITDQLRQLDAKPTVLSVRDFGTASEAFIARVKDKEISLPDDPYLRDAIGAAVTRYVGQSVVLDRRKSRAEIPELIACVVALRLLENAPRPMAAPYVGG